MIVNVRVNREILSLVVGVIVLLFSFVTLMWFPSAFLSALWALMVFVGSAFIAATVMLIIYNLLGKVSADDEDTEDEEELEVG